MPLYLQDPNDPKSAYLLEALLEACDGAISGGGAFAFASTQGVNLVLADKAFRKFSKNGNFELIVGGLRVGRRKRLRHRKSLQRSV